MLRRTSGSELEVSDGAERAYGEPRYNWRNRVLESIEILEKLVGFRTVSRSPNIELMRYIRDLLADAGIRSDLMLSDTGQNANLFATVGPSDRPGVMLSGHTDVVPVDGQHWTVDPFRLCERQGKLFGRGTADMKGFVACAIRVAILASERDLKTPLHLAFSYDEEVGCVGVRTMISVLQTAPITPALCIVGEPTSLEIANGHKGKTAARAICRGLSVHSALAPTGINAIHLAGEFVALLRNIQANLAYTGASDSAYDIPYTTIHVGTISGGTALNIVPEHCCMDFEVRNIHQDDPNEILGMIENGAATIAKKYGDGAVIELETVNSYPGLETPLDAAVIEFMKSLTGRNSTTKVAFGTEGGLFNERLGVPTVVFGPGSMAQGHKPDEYVERKQLDMCDEVLESLLNRLSAGSI